MTSLFDYASRKGVNIDDCTMTVCDLAQWNLINRWPPMTKPPAQIVHYLKPTVCPETWRNKVLVQIWFFNNKCGQLKNMLVQVSENITREWKRWGYGLQCFSGSLNNLKWLFVNHYDLDKFIIYNPILHYIQEW